MELIERDGFLAMLQTQFQQVAGGEGHCVFLSGEAGMGKTSLVNAFCKEQQEDCNIYQGFCDALFSPRLLAPLYDIIGQLNRELWPDSHSMEDRSELFSGLFLALNRLRRKILIVFEDIHWADEATLDFIKYFSRRIKQLPCLFILTYRDDEIHSRHPLRNVLGQLPPDSFTRMKLGPLSKEAVGKMAIERGYSGEDVFDISGGNPFYVKEILSSYSLGVPDNIKDSIISVYNRQEERAKQVWELIAVIPDSLEIKYLEKFEPLYAEVIERSLESKILIIHDGLIYFKHELFRRTIESSLSPLKRVALNKRILDLLRERFEENQEIERIIHHAKNANDYELVVHYAPKAALQASSVGAHIEASRLYLTAIEYYQGKEKDQLIQFYEPYSYECYLTNQIKEAIIYAGKLLILWKQDNDKDRMGNCMRFLSRLWWLDGNLKNAEGFAGQAIELLMDQPASPAKAMAFSNMAQLKILLDQSPASIELGEKAISIASELGDEETLSHALNNVGSVLLYKHESKQKGIELLQQSLEIALKNSFHEHAARAYSNLGSVSLGIKNYAFSKKYLEEGILYCEERDLESWRANMLSLKSRLDLETGDWVEANNIADSLLKNENQLPSFSIRALTVMATIKTRKGDADALPLLLKAGKMALETTELQRIIPSLIALLEYEWLTGGNYIKTDDLDRTKARIDQSINIADNHEFAFWLLKARNQRLVPRDVFEGYALGSITKAQKAAAFWEKLGNPFAQAIVLYEGNDEDKRMAITLIQNLGAHAVHEKMKLEMRNSGIKGIPRGIRESTRLNPALLTDRELDVLQLLKEGLQNKEIAGKLFISAKTIDHHISSILFKLDVNSRVRAVSEAVRRNIIK